MAATKVSQERQGPLLALSIGGAGRRIADMLDESLLIHGGDGNFGQGVQWYCGVRFLFEALNRRFPANEEAEMLRAGIEFFAFTPAQSETCQLLFLRFDEQLERANA